ncbi:hypothetical protein ABPG72_004917 [Tetrahymena utriculariae]
MQGSNQITRNKKLGDKGIEVLSTEIAQLKNLQNLNLNLESNLISESGIQILIKKIAQSSLLTNLSLKLQENNFGDTGAKLLGEELLNLKKSLKKLSINLGQKKNQTFQESKKLYQKRSNKLQSVGVCGFVQKISMLNQLSDLELNFEYNYLLHNDISVIVSCITQLRNLQNLIKLKLGNNKIEDQGLASLSQQMQFWMNLQHLNLIINVTKITDAGVSELSKGISKLIKLNSLEIDLEKNSIVNQGAISLGQSIRNLKNLQILSINLTYNIFCINKSYFKIFSDNQIFSYITSEFIQCVSNQIGIKIYKLDKVQGYVEDTKFSRYRLERAYFISQYMV